MDALSYVLIFLVVLVLGLYYYRQYMNYRKEQDSTTWPKKISECPDYWSKSADSSKGNTCENRLNIPTSCAADAMKELDLTQYPAPADKCKWAKGCAVPWEGIDTQCA